MSDALSDPKLGSQRRLRREERDVIAEMVRGTALEAAVLRRLDDVLVRDMADGGMGSIRFVSKPSARPSFGKQVAEGAFRDADGAPVSVVLNVDGTGELFEFDVFKADGSPLIRYPGPGDLDVIHRHGQPGLAPP